jgi:K+-sensing histidine kinase KdpD
MSKGLNSMKQLLGKVVRPLTGIILCIIAALIAIIGSVDHPWRASVPILLLAVIVLLAHWCGMFVSVIGSATSALLFAYNLFPPIGSFRVSSPAERENLAWMLLGSIVISYLLRPPAIVEHRSDTQRISKG